MRINKAAPGKGSSLIATTAGIIFWGVLGLFCLWQRLVLPAILFIFLLLTGAVSRWWGNRAIRRVNIGIECENTRLFPGGSTTLTYIIKNEKAVPLPWMELSQNVPYKNCLKPDKGFERYKPMGQDGHKRTSFALRQNIPYVAGRETLRIDTNWKAQRRGIYDLRGFVARSGDGFGLVQNEKSLPDGNFPVIAVYPRRVNVDTELFFRDQWSVSEGGCGWMEDNTVLRGIRSYLPGDNWKHINWRMAARGQGLQTNLYQEVKPKQMHFIFDGESFCIGKQKKDGSFLALEDALEVLASVIAELCAQNAVCRLTLPKSEFYSPRTVNAEEGDAAPLLFSLAGYEPVHVRIPEKEDFEPSRFSSRIPMGEENCYLFTECGSDLPKDIIRQADRNRLRILCRRGRDAALALGYRAYPLDLLRKGGNAE